MEFMRDEDFIVVDEKNFFHQVKEFEKKECKKLKNLDWIDRLHQSENYEINLDY